MEISSDFDKLIRLAVFLDQERNEIEKTIEHFESQVKRIISNTRSEYREDYVQSALNQLERAIEEVKKEKNRLCGRIEKNAKELQKAARLYQESERAAMAEIAKQSVVNPFMKVMRGKENLVSNVEAYAGEDASYLAGAAFGADTVLGGYIGTGAPTAVEKINTYYIKGFVNQVGTRIESELPKVWRINKLGKKVMHGNASKISIARCESIARRTNEIRGISNSIEKGSKAFLVKPAVTGGRIASCTSAMKAIGTRLGIVGAGLEGGYNIYRDVEKFNNGEYTKEKRDIAIGIHSGAMVASGFAVVGVAMATATLPAVAAIGIAIGVGCLINWGSDKLMEALVGK